MSGAMAESMQDGPKSSPPLFEMDFFTFSLEVLHPPSWTAIHLWETPMRWQWQQHIWGTTLLVELSISHSPHHRGEEHPTCFIIRSRLPTLSPHCFPSTRPAEAPAEGDINYVEGRCLINNQPWRNDVALEMQRPSPHLAGAWESAGLTARGFGGIEEGSSGCCSHWWVSHARLRLRVCLFGFFFQLTMCKMHHQPTPQKSLWPGEDLVPTAFAKTLSASLALFMWRF